ncbi:MAG TPA: SPOR domain-containing protein [Ensifer sp.]|nr:SPOR domain-containing protein [Ensifer sp.]
MADNRRAGERTIFRGDVEGNDTLAEISRALEAERRTPIAVGAGFVPPTGGQASNIPAMADLEDELLREFALYEGPREPMKREPTRKVEPGFEPLAQAAVPVSAPADPVVASDDDDDTMPPMEAGAMFRAARTAPIVRTPTPSAPVGEASRVEPEPPAVFMPEPHSDIDLVPAVDEHVPADVAAGEPPVSAADVQDFADWDLDDGQAVAELASAPLGEGAIATQFDAGAEELAEDVESVFTGPVPDFDLEEELTAAAVPEIELDGPAAANVEPVFAGPVPDLDFADEPAFAGPVPDIDLNDGAGADAELVFAGPVPSLNLETEPTFAGPVPDFDLNEPEELDAEPVFAGPVPDFNFSDADAENTAEDPQSSSVQQLEGELEQSLGALDLAPEAALEPASPFAAWKNDRLAAVETTTPAWLSSAALAAKPLPLGDENPVPVLAPSEEGLVSQSLAAVEEQPVEPAEELASSGEAETDLFGDFEFELDTEDLMATDAMGQHGQSSSVDAAPVAHEVVAPRVEESRPYETASYLPVEPEAPAYSAKPAAVAASVAAPVAVAAADRMLDMPDWLNSGRKAQGQAAAAPVLEKKDADFDFKEFEFDFDEDAIEAEVSRAVMSELQTAKASQPVDEFPFDPTAITEIEDRMPASFGNMDVPQVPDQDGEALPKPVSDFDYDIEAEMAELFAMGGKGKAQAGSAHAVETAAQAGEGDDLDNGLANEIIRSIHEAPAIPAGRAFDMAEINASSTNFVSRYARVAAFAALVAFAGVGAVMLWRSGDVPGLSTDGAPRVIMADKSPVKEVPEQPGGKQVPNQDKAVYERVSGKTPEVVKQDSLIANSEEPVNVAEKTLGDDPTTPADGQAPGVTDSASASDADARLPATPSQPGGDGQTSNETVAPRKVKTMIVLPNGTMVARETNAPADTASQQKPAGADAAMTAPVSTAKAEASQPAATLAPANGAPAAQATEQAAAPAKAIAAPIPTARPAEQPVNVVGTVMQRGNVVGQQAATEKPASKPAPQTASAPVASNTPAGAYVIQIASLPSEAEAQKSYANLSAKFSSVIGGKTPDIKPAEIPGKGTYYRLRIVAGSKEDAIALCSRYKAAGGSCLVSR